MHQSVLFAAAAVLVNPKLLYIIIYTLTACTYSYEHNDCSDDDDDRFPFVRALDSTRLSSWLIHPHPSSSIVAMLPSLLLLLLDGAQLSMWRYSLMANLSNLLSQRESKRVLRVSVLHFFFISCCCWVHLILAMTLMMIMIQKADYSYYFLLSAKTEQFASRHHH